MDHQCHIEKFYRKVDQITVKLFLDKTLSNHKKDSLIDKITEFQNLTLEYINEILVCGQTNEIERYINTQCTQFLMDNTLLIKYEQ